MVKLRCNDCSADLGEIKISLPENSFVLCPTCADRHFPKTKIVPPMDFEGICRVCGCTDELPCEGGCSWIEPDLCSRCANEFPALAESMLLVKSCHVERNYFEKKEG